MLTRHVSKRLARYADGELTSADSGAVEAHLSSCPRCRRELEQIRFAAGLVRQLAVVSAPPSVWSAVDAALAAPPSPSPRTPMLQWAFAAAVLLAAVLGAWSWFTRSDDSQRWEVAALTNGGAIARMAVGEWIETAGISRVQIKVGDIGTVDVESGSRVRLGAMRPNEYRLALARGTISAQIDAPPRLFIVDTPASTVVDLGCAYTMTVADDGAGVLRMTEGWTALEWKGRESLVPAGAVCRTRPEVGPGTPYFEDAPATLRQAVDEFDSRGGGAAAIDVMLRDARVRDTLTLWHLLSRVEAEHRPRVYDRIAMLVAPPATVSRDKALQLDPEALRLLREELAWHW